MELLDGDLTHFLYNLLPCSILKHMYNDETIINKFFNAYINFSPIAMFKENSTELCNFDVIVDCNSIIEYNSNQNVEQNIKDIIYNMYNLFSDFDLNEYNNFIKKYTELLKIYMLIIILIYLTLWNKLLISHLFLTPFT